MDLGEAVAEGVRRYLHDQDSKRRDMQRVSNAEVDVAAWSEDHLDWFLSNDFARNEPRNWRHKYFAEKRAAAWGKQ